MRTLALALALLAIAVPASLAVGERSGECQGAVPVDAGALMLDHDIVDQLTPMTACVGKIQPGASMHWCTLNWVVADETGALYIGTAGHCAAKGWRISAAGVGTFGTVVYSINKGVGNDYALIKIDESKYPLVSPTLCHWGGPLGAATYAGDVNLREILGFPAWLGGGLKGVGVAAETPALLHYGWGVGTNQHEATRARVGAAAASTGPGLVLHGNYNPGDSGSPVMFADGNVAGVVTHSFLVDPAPVAPGPREGPPLAVVDQPSTGAGLGFATRFDHALALAEAATGHDFTLVTSDVLPGAGVLDAL